MYTVNKCERLVPPIVQHAGHSSSNYASEQVPNEGLGSAVPQCGHTSLSGSYTARKPLSSRIDYVRPDVLRPIRSIELVLVVPTEDLSDRKLAQVWVVGSDAARSLCDVFLVHLVYPRDDERLYIRRCLKRDSEVVL